MPWDHVATWLQTGLAEMSECRESALARPLASGDDLFHCAGANWLSRLAVRAPVCPQPVAPLLLLWSECPEAVRRLSREMRRGEHTIPTCLLTRAIMESRLRPLFSECAASCWTRLAMCIGLPHA